MSEVVEKIAPQTEMKVNVSVKDLSPNIVSGQVKQKLALMALFMLFYRRLSVFIRRMKTALLQWFGILLGLT